MTGAAPTGGGTPGRVLLVVAHPRRDSFTRALADAARSGLESAGRQVDEIDLYRDGFRAAMSPDEWHAYATAEPLIDHLTRRYAELARAADTLVFVYPTWWSGLPAMLKGWLERVLVPGVGFRFDQRTGRVRPGLTHVRHIVGISTYGSPRRYVTLTNDNGRRTLHRALRMSCGWRTRTTWLGLYAIDTASDAERAAFVRAVQERVARIGATAAGGRASGDRSDRPATATATRSATDTATGTPTTSATGTATGTASSPVARRFRSRRLQRGLRWRRWRRARRRVLVVFCHPERGSLVGASLDRVLAGLDRGGHQVRVRDLYAEGFEPQLTADDHRNHLRPGAAPELDGHAADLRWADTIVLVYPTWWSGQPAMLKGWIDRVWVCGVAWDLPAGADRLVPRLRNVRRLVVVTTHGSPKWINALQGEGGKRTVSRSLRLMCHPRCRTRWWAFYGADRATPDRRRAFLERVEVRAARP